MKLALLVLTVALVSARADAPGGSPDPVFANIPLDRWSEKDPGMHFRWSSEVSKPTLSQHQRLAINIKIQMDGSEVLKREGQGRLLLLIQMRDQTGRVFQTHNLLSLENVNPDSNRTATQYLQDAFVLPGDYQVSLGLFVPKTGEHAITRRSLHVDPLPHDPLPDAWRELPSVEFLPEEATPDSWYLPTVEGRLNLHLETKRPVSIDVLVNGSSTEQLPATRRVAATKTGPGVLIPAVKALSHMKVGNGSARIAFLDLERRRVSFEQTVEHNLQWRELRDALTEATPNKIDLASLENRGQNPQFFLNEIQRRALQASDTKPLCVLILLSGPMAFDKANVKPIPELNNPDCKVFYLRFHPMTTAFRAPPYVFGGPAEGRGRGVSRTGGGPMNPGLPAYDELFNLTKPLHPRLFDVTTPEEVRKALATILSEVARLGND
jgi:hypothetical protein